ncbi:MAG: acyl-CoA thioester hydrolase [Lentimonas sp.]|jgi:acyl-CoA thioester hydrolase
MQSTLTYDSYVHFDEMDALGLLHRTRYLIHLERAQQKFFKHLLGVEDFNAERDEDIYVVVHSLESRFREAVRAPGPIVVDYRIQRIRSGGVTMAFTIRDPQGERIFCDGTRTVCKLSGQTHRPIAWSEPFRLAMETFANG